MADKQKKAKSQTERRSSSSHESVQSDFPTRRNRSDPRLIDLNEQSDHQRIPDSIDLLATSRIASIVKPGPRFRDLIYRSRLQQIHSDALVGLNTIRVSPKEPSETTQSTVSPTASQDSTSSKRSTPFSEPEGIKRHKSASTATPAPRVPDRFDPVCSNDHEKLLSEIRFTRRSDKDFRFVTSASGIDLNDIQRFEEASAKLSTIERLITARLKSGGSLLYYEFDDVWVELDYYKALFSVIQTFWKEHYQPTNQILKTLLSDSSSVPTQSVPKSHLTPLASIRHLNPQAHHPSPSPASSLSSGSSERSSPSGSQISVTDPSQFENLAFCPVQH